MNINDEEDLGFINSLLERLHQADLKNFGSHIQLIYVAPGAQHVENIQTQNFGGATSGTLSPAPDKGGKWPDVFSTPEAMMLWQKVQQAGYVDANCQPLISRTQAAILAYEMAKRLDIKDKWKLFETLWRRRNMYRDYYDALNQGQSLEFRDELRAIFG